MPVLVDTSAWIRFLQGREPLTSEVDRWLALDAVRGHELGSPPHSFGRFAKFNQKIQVAVHGVEV